MITEVTKQMQETFVASAITDILINAASETPTAEVILVLPQGSQQRYSSGMGKAKPIQPTACQKTSYVQGPDQRLKVYNGVKACLKTFLDRSGPGVVLLVYSVILTRGIERIREDMDMPDCSLVNEHGYASQELLNIMLVGKAASNVHDGNKDLGGGFILKGIHK
jgi:ubiquitin carboxyl-terminal hydrolase MINDY-3/4